MMEELSDDAIATLVLCADNRPNEDTLIVIRTLGGAISRVSPQDSAYPHRTARFNLSIDCSWSDPEDDATNISWARQPGTRCAASQTAAST